MSEGLGGGSALGPTPADEPYDPYAYPHAPRRSSQPATPVYPGYAAPQAYDAYRYGAPPSSPYPTAPYPTAPYPTAPYPTAPYPTAPYPAWGYPPPTPPTGRRHTIVRVAAVGAAVLALVVAGVAASRSGQSTHSPADDAALAASRRTILAELPKLQTFVATDRGLTWKKSVDPEVLADADFVRALNSGDSSGGPADDPKDPDDIGTTYAAMGLVKDADTFYSDAEGATNSDVTGFYDDQTGRLVVRGTAWTPLMEYTLVHELTHAIQDQNFNLSTLDSSTRTDDETILTVRAVVEGDAERVADDYYDKQSSSWQDQVDNADGSAPSSASPIVDVYGAMPYAFGEQFVMGLYDKGGNHAVDQAFHGPPTTSAQLLHPDKWLAGTMPAPTPPERPAAPAGDLADIGVLGQLGLWSAVDAAHPHLKDTAQLDGWLGDSYVSTDGDSGACFVDQIHFVGASQRATAVTFLRGWTDAQHITVTPDGPADLRLSACKK